MKVIAIGSFFVLLAMVAGIPVFSPAFADHIEVTIVPVADSKVPGCEKTPEGCWDPMIATVDVGGKVIFSNTDQNGSHTFTSGTPFEGPSDVFNSSLLFTDGSYEWIATNVGEYPYFCMIHPWMEGLLVVVKAGTDTMMGEDDIELMVTITDSAVEDGTQVDLEFTELHVNYEITATQNGEVVLQETAYAIEMTASHMVDAVGSNENPIDVEIVSLGIGPPDDEQNWTGPLGTVATAQVVPEFGTIAMMILAVAIISIVAVTAKSRVIPRL